MHPVFPVTRELPMLDAARTRALEQRAAAAPPAHALMQRAGDAVARLALAIAPHAQRVWIACGPGNNGGDGLAAAPHLQAAGRDVACTLVGDAARLPADAADALARARAAGIPVTVGDAPPQPPDLAIDALLGVGASRAPDGALAAAIQRLGALACPVLAIDVPSGLHPGTGQLLGIEAVRATHTLALLSLKPGLCTGAGRDHAGRLWLDILGVETDADPTAWLAGVVPAPARAHDRNKGSFGDVAVVGGATGMTGAGLLAGRAALAAGAGRVYVELLDRTPATPQLDPVHPELMFRGGWGQAEAARLAKTTVVCGCGGGQAVRGAMPQLMAHARRLVLDADALNALATDAPLADHLRARVGRGQGTVLTPHPLEAARLLGCATAEVQSDRLAAAREIADRYGCAIVLKGSGSVIAAPDATPRINATGNAALATAGTGDVLAGWLGGRWAQGHGADEPALAFEAACRAVAEHGAAADPVPASGVLRASDLIERLAGRL